MVRRSEELGCQVINKLHLKTNPFFFTQIHLKVVAFLLCSGPSRFLSKLVLARDGLKPDGRFPRTPDYIEECQHPEAFDPNIVTDSILICTFSSGFYNGTSTVTAIVNTAKTLHLSGFVLIANSNYGDYIAEPIPLSLPGILIPKVSDTRVL